MRRTCKDVKSLFWDKDSGADISISRDSFEPQRSSAAFFDYWLMGLAEEPFKHKQSMCVEQRIIVLCYYCSARVPYNILVSWIGAR